MVKVLTQANQYTVDTPVGGAGELRAANAMLSSARELGSGVKDLKDTIAVSNAEEALSSIDEQAVSQASALYTTNKKTSVSLSGSSAQAATLKFNKTIKELASSNPRVRSKILAIARYGAQNNPILTAQAAIREKQDEELANQIVEGRQLAINNGMPNASIEQTRELVMDKRKKEADLQTRKNENEMAKLVAETTDEKQEAQVSFILTDATETLGTQFQTFLQMTKMSLNDAKARPEISTSVDLSKFKDDKEWRTFLTKQILTDISELSALTSKRVHKNSITGSDFKRTQEQLNAFNKNIDNIKNSVSNDDVRKYLERDANVVIAENWLKILGQSPAVALGITLMSKMPNLGDTPSGKLAIEQIRRTMIDSLAATKRQNLPNVSPNNTEEEDTAEKELVRELGEQAQDKSEDGLNQGTPERKEMAIGIIENFSQQVIKEVVDLSNMATQTFNDLMDAVTGIDPEGTSKQETFPKTAIDTVQKLLSDVVVPSMRDLFEPLTNKSGTIVNIMSFLSTPGSSVAKQSELDPKKPITLNVTKDGAISLTMNTLTDEYKEFEGEIKSIISDFNSEAGTISKAIGFIAKQTNTSIEEGIEMFLQDNFGIKEGDSGSMSTPTEAESDKSYQEALSLGIEAAKATPPLSNATPPVTEPAPVSVAEPAPASVAESFTINNPKALATFGYHTGRLNRLFGKEGFKITEEGLIEKLMPMVKATRYFESKGKNTINPDTGAAGPYQTIPEEARRASQSLSNSGIELSDDMKLLASFKNKDLVSPEDGRTAGKNWKQASEIIKNMSEDDQELLALNRYFEGADSDPVLKEFLEASNDSVYAKFKFFNDVYLKVYHTKPDQISFARKVEGAALFMFNVRRSDLSETQKGILDFAISLSFKDSESVSSAEEEELKVAMK